jgi:hypothetical protein
MVAEVGGYFVGTAPRRSLLYAIVLFGYVVKRKRKKS